MNKLQAGEGGYPHGPQPNAPRIARLAFMGWGGFGNSFEVINTSFEGGSPDAVGAVASLLVETKRFINGKVSGEYRLGLWERLDNVYAAYGITKDQQPAVYSQALDSVLSAPPELAGSEQAEQS